MIVWKKNCKMSDTDLLRLAQLQKATDLSKEQKLDLVKKINVHYSIPNESHKVLQKKSYIGYNCLHFAVLNLDENCTHELLNRVADPFKQGTQDHKTPLHLAVDSIRSNGRNKIWKISGKLQSCPVVNTLLSAHVTSGNSLNPKCKNGISHLHIACMFNCTDAVKFFLINGEMVNQVTNLDAHWPAYTPLHFAARYSSVEAARCLMNNGADMLAKDAKGITALNLLINRLLKVYHSFYSSLTMKLQSKEEFSAMEAIMTIFLENKSISDILDDTGLTTFHVACTFRDSAIAAQFLNNNIDLNVAVKVNSKLWSGWSPLHFAACLNADTVKLLVQNGADITVKNAEGKTPLDICLKTFSPSVIHSILSTKDEFKSIVLTDESTTLLDLLLAMDNTESFDKYLRPLEDPNIYIPFTSPILPHCSLLHLAVLMSKRTIMQDDLVEEMDSKEYIDSMEDYDYESEEFYDQMDLTLLIKPCLEKGCSTTMVNSDHLTPIHSAFRNHCAPCTLDILLASCERDAVDPDNLSLLHIACAVGNPEAVSKLIHAGSDINIATKRDFQWYKAPSIISKPHFLYPIHAKSTPLHVAATFANSHVVELLLDNSADVYAEDAEGFTPIHLSIVPFGSFSETAEAIFSRAQSYAERVSPVGLSHLHVAALNGASKPVEALILKGANVNGSVATRVPEFLARFAGKTPLGLAMRNRYDNGAVEALIEHGADIYADGVLQDLMAKVDHRRIQPFVDRLQLRDDARGPIDPSGLTLLHVACGSCNLRWAEELLNKGADVNARIRDDEDYQGPWKGYTPLHVLASRMEGANHIGVTIKLLAELARLLLKHKADTTIGSCDGTALHIAYRWALQERIWETSSSSEESYGYSSDDSYVERMTGQSTRLAYCDAIIRLLENQLTYQVNPTDSNGFSHFHLANKESDIKVVEKFLNGGVDINHSTNPFSDEFAAYTALHFVIDSDNFTFETMCFYLIERGADLNAENRDGNTPVHFAVSRKRIFWPDVMDCFKRHGANFEARNLKGETPADVLLTASFTLEQLQYLLSNGSSITLRRGGSLPGTVTLIMSNAESADRLEVLKIFMKVCNLEAAAKNGYDPIQDVARTCTNSNFGRQLDVNSFLDVIWLFVNEGWDIDQRDQHGNTPLSTSCFFRNTAAVGALLKAGADVNNIIVNSEIHNIIRGPLALQLYKIKILGLHLNAANNEMYKEFERTLKIDTNFKEICKLEMEKARSVAITNSVTAKALLSETEAVVDYWKMLPDQRQDIDLFFKRLTYLKKEFPQFCGIMVLQYKKALARSKLIKPAKEALAMACDIDLPDPCSEGILDYFSNDELKYLIKHFEEISHPLKRRKIE